MGRLGWLYEIVQINYLFVSLVEKWSDLGAEGSLAKEDLGSRVSFWALISVPASWQDLKHLRKTHHWQIFIRSPSEVLQDSHFTSQWFRGYFRSIILFLQRLRYSMNWGNHCHSRHGDFCLLSLSSQGVNAGLYLSFIAWRSCLLLYLLCRYISDV